MTELGLEWQALECIVKDPTSPDDLAQVREILTAPGMDLGELLDQCIRHQLLCRFAAIVLNKEWESILPMAVHFHLMESLRLNRYRTSVLRSAACRLATEFRAAGIPFAATKGIVLESTVYRGEGTRRMRDLDLMISAEDRGRVAEMLSRLGFKNGRYRWESATLEALDRRTEVTYKLHPDHLPHFLRVTDDPIVPYIAIDVANSLTWHASSWSIPTQEVLKDVQWIRIGEGADEWLPRMSWSAGFLFTILHFFREAWFEANLDDGAYVTLAKMADVFLIWKYYQPFIQEEGFRELVVRYSLERPVAWVLAHVDRSLGSSMLATLELQEYGDEAWLTSMRGVDGDSVVCSATMRERLWSKTPRHLLRRANA